LGMSMNMGIILIPNPILMKKWVQLYELLSNMNVTILNLFK
jgi:hypothetical protein